MASWESITSQIKLDEIRRKFLKETGRGEPAGLYYKWKKVNPPPVQVYNGPDTTDLEVKIWCEKAARKVLTRQPDIINFARDTFF